MNIPTKFYKSTCDRSHDTCCSSTIDYKEVSAALIAGMGLY
jgi:hypothetical protein